MTNAAASVRVAQGELLGTSDNGISAFLGIPYAAAPFGDARMLPPRPAPSWDGVRDGDRVRADVPEGPNTRRNTRRSFPRSTFPARNA